MMVKNKKAQISISFNWIFVIIAGIVFLTFFFSIISSQSKSSEVKVSATIAKQFETIIETTSQQSGTFKIYKTSPIELNFYCDMKQALSYYSVKDHIAGYTTHDVLFSPESMVGTQMFTWTQSWSYPYPVTNFLYVTNKYQMFIFFEGENVDYSVLKLEQNLPSNLTIFKMDYSNQPNINMNNDLYTYIFTKNQIDKNIVDLTSVDFVKDKSRIVIIDSNSDIFGDGKVYFFNDSNIGDFKTPRAENFKSNYYGESSLYGALFTGNKEIYECNMDKAFRRLEMLNKLNEYRIEETLPLISPTSTCYYHYAGSSSTDKTSLKSYVADFSSILSSGFTNINQEELSDIKVKIANKNSRITAESRCPPLY